MSRVRNVGRRSRELQTCLGSQSSEGRRGRSLVVSPVSPLHGRGDLLLPDPRKPCVCRGICGREPPGTSVGCGNRAVHFRAGEAVLVCAEIVLGVSNLEFKHSRSVCNSPTRSSVRCDLHPRSAGLDRSPNSTLHRTRSRWLPPLSVILLGVRVRAGELRSVRRRGNQSCSTNQRYQNLRNRLSYPSVTSGFDHSGLAMLFSGRRIYPTLALRFTPVGVRPTSPPSIPWYNVFGPTTPPRPLGGGPSRETQTIASSVSAASPLGQRSIARPNSSTISPLTTGHAASLRALFKPFLAGASPTLVSTASKLLSCHQTLPRLRYSTAVPSRKKACCGSTAWFAASPRTFCSTHGLEANRNSPEATPNSALERTSARYSAGLESRASSGPKPLSLKR